MWMQSQIAEDQAQISSNVPQVSVSRYGVYCITSWPVQQRATGMNAYARKAGTLRSNVPRAHPSLSLHVLVIDATTAIVVCKY